MRVSYRSGHGAAPNHFLGRPISVFHIQFCCLVRVWNERFRAWVPKGVQPAEDLRDEPDVQTERAEKETIALDNVYLQTSRGCPWRN